MSVCLTHRQALYLARQAGVLFARLHGAPDLVIGVRCAGVPVAMAFADGARASRTRFVTRVDDPGYKAGKALARLGRLLVPQRLRRLGRRLAYRQIMVATTKLPQLSGAPSTPAIQELDELRETLARGSAPAIVVVDDAIDTGLTMRRVVDAIGAIDLAHSITTFALTSTLSLRVHERQHHLFEEVIEYVEGDLALLDEAAAAGILAGLALPRRTTRSAQGVAAGLDLEHWPGDPASRQDIMQALRR